MAEKHPPYGRARRGGGLDSRSSQTGRSVNGPRRKGDGEEIPGVSDVARAGFSGALRPPLPSNRAHKRESEGAGGEISVRALFLSVRCGGFAGGRRAKSQNECESESEEDF